MLFGFPIVHQVIQVGIGCIILALFIRVILSWFRVDERYAFVRFLAYISDPFITPIRRMMRSTASIMDISYLFVFFLLSVFIVILLQALPVGW
jgi:uncharacterized protein YggT (Ycf19 family)